MTQSIGVLGSLFWRVCSVSSSPIRCLLCNQGVNMTVSTGLYQNGKNPNREDFIATLFDLEEILLSKAALKLFLIYVESACHHGFSDAYSHLLSRVFYQCVTSGYKVDQYALRSYLERKLGWSDYAADKVFWCCSSFNSMERLMLDSRYLVRRYPDMCSVVSNDSIPASYHYFTSELVEV